MLKHRTVSDLMTHAVVRVRPDTPFKEIVKKLADHDITAVPVVDDEDHPVGVVSEADLLRRQAGLPEPAGLPALLDAPPSEPVRQGTTADALMSAPAVVGRPQWSVVEAARAMDQAGIKRLPVVDDTGRLVGIVSRADLLRIIAAARPEKIASGDEALEISATARLRDADTIFATCPHVTVADGVVHLWGQVRSQAERDAARVAVEGIEGINGVEDHLSIAQTA